jgi:nitrite reductase/ring-hydroxylating ferredoxin subunit
MPTWTRLTRVSDCLPGTATEVVAGDKMIALFNVNGTFHALDGVCPHQGGPLGQGMLAGCVVTCPWHGWQFDVRDGQHQFNSQMVQPRYEVRVDGDWILVDLG